jgi:class 3 adenylate cyclase
MEIEDWLGQLGLAQYAPSFRANDITTALLPSLTADDLKELGVSSVGHRRRLLDAIAALSAVPLREDARPDQPTMQASAGGSDERRQMSVLFCDLVGFTPLAARLDAEDLAATVRLYHGAVARCIRGQGGHVAQFLGDGVMAYFGWPLASEDDAERAVRAALDAMRAVARLESPAGPLAARAGIATGLVVGGDLIGEGAGRGGVVGETPNLAARLQAEAEPGTVAVCPTTRRLAGNLFTWADLDVRRLKGVAQPVPIARAIDESGIESRFEARQPGRATLLIGRDEELELLRRRWDQARAGEGRVVLITGEPGIGKSRLAAALLDAAVPRAEATLRWFCSPLHSETALHPILARLGRAAGFARDDTAAERLVKLETLLADTAPSADEFALFADALGIDTQGRYPRPSGTPQKQRERLLGALIGRIARLATQMPVLAVLEDAHWADATTREFLDLLASRLPDHAIMLLVTHRPEFSVAWAAQPHVTTLPLRRLDRRANAVLIREVAGGKGVPDEIEAQIQVRADGVPLFIEELTRAVLEGGALREERDRWVASDAGSAISAVVPATLQASLMARLDRLAPAREVAQIAAVLGREFSYQLLAAVTRLPEDRLRTALGELAAAGLIQMRGAPPDAHCLFRHALIQEAASAVLLRSRRAELHLRAARVLETEFPEIAEAQPELVGRHFAEGAHPSEAATAWERAGRRALLRSAQLEAESCFNEALRQVACLPEGELRDRRELELLLQLSGPRHAVRGAAPESEALLRRACTLAEKLGDSDAYRHAAMPLAGYLVIAGRYADTVAAGEAMRRMLGDAAHGPLRSHVGRVVGWGSMFLGRLSEAEQELAACVERFRDRSVTTGRSGFGTYNNPVLTGAAAMAFVQWALGHPSAALALCEEVEAALDAPAEETTNTQGFVHSTGLMVALLARLPARARRSAQRLYELADRDGAPWWRTNAAWGDAAAQIMGGDTHAGLRALQAALATKRGMGGLQWDTWIRTIEAEALLSVGAVDEAVSVMAGAERSLASTDARYFEPEVHRVAGALALHQGAHKRAEERFMDAIAAARAQSALSWELRAALSLAAMLRGQGRAREAHALLAPIMAAFRERTDLPDHRDAERLLRHLAAAAA